ncbi:MAG: ATP-binding protein [Turicibacter sanguinis]|uniref:ATP-binding protein n=1 Tax=Turicibacter sanguinis TaxID=154288 RepID=UPI0039930B4E
MTIHLIKLKLAKNERVLQHLKKKFDKYHIIILDELSYSSFDKEVTELLFNYIYTRCERASPLFTTNLVFSRWNDRMATIIVVIIYRIPHLIIYHQREWNKLFASTSPKIVKFKSQI